MLLNVADFFSKTLQKNLFNINLKRLGMVGSFRDEVESRALKAYDHSDWVNAPSARSWHLYHVLHGQIDSDFRHPRDLAATTAALCTCCTQLIRHQHIPKLISLNYTSLIVQCTPGDV